MDELVHAAADWLLIRDRSNRCDLFISSGGTSKVHPSQPRLHGSKAWPATVIEGGITHGVLSMDAFLFGAGAALGKVAH
jgi:hypothetical protein